MAEERIENDAADRSVDDRLKREFARILPPSGSAGQVLAELGPAVSRAKRKRLATQVALGAAACLLLAGGFGLAVQNLANQDGSATVAGEGELAEREDADRGEEAPAVTLEVAGTTTSTTSTNQATAQQTTTATATDLSTATNLTTTSAGGPPSTTTDPDGNTRIESRCGSIIVSVSGEDVTLIEVLPNPGYDSEIEKSGPESIEVKLENNYRECELKAKVENGKLETEGDE